MSNNAGLQRLLILDDDADFRKLVLIYLKKMFEGIELVEYDPVAQGVPGEDFDWSQYDVLLLDYYLCIHGVTGLDILQANRKNKFFPATIMLTGAGNEEVAVRALKAGVYEYLRKEKLDKAELRTAILDAFEKHKAERERLSELTNQSHAFNKALFYQQLEHSDDEEKKRVLLLIELDNHEVLEERLGIILRDNIIRHIARQSFEIFQLGECDPNITRFSDTSVALLINDPGSEKTLEFNLQGLCKHLEKRPYKFEDKKFRFSVSIGVVNLSSTKGSAEELISAVRRSSAIANETEGNTFYIYSQAPQQAVPVTNAQASKPESQTDAPEEEVVEAAPVIDEVPQQAPVVDDVPPPTIETTEKQPPARPAVTPQAAPAVVSEAPPPAPVEEKKAEAGKEIETPKPETTASESTKPDALSPPTEEAPAKVEKEAAGKTARTPEPAKPPPPASELKAEPKKETPKTMASTAPKAVDTTKQQSAGAPARQVTPEPAPAKKAAAPKPKPPEKDEAELIESELDEAALRIKRAFDEKRVIPTFQPIISLSDTGEEEELEVHSISLQMLETDGKIVEADEIYARSNTPAFRKFIDRWMIREAIGRVVNSDTQYVFVIALSQDSLADATLFNWLRKLLSGLDEQNPGKSITLEITAPDFSAKEKQVGALIAYLGKSHGFRFTLSQFSSLEEVNNLTTHAKFNLIKVNHELIKELNEHYAEDSKTSALQDLKALGVNIVADKVEDATTLTEVISAGADYAIGNFIGEPTQQLDEMTNVESFEII